MELECILFFACLSFYFCSSCLKLWDVCDKKLAKNKPVSVCDWDASRFEANGLGAHTRLSDARQRVVLSGANLTCAESSVNHNNSCGDVEQLWLRGFACRAACVATARICSADWNNITPSRGQGMWYPRSATCMRSVRGCRCECVARSLHLRRAMIAPARPAWSPLEKGCS